VSPNARKVQRRYHKIDQLPAAVKGRCLAMLFEEKATLTEVADYLASEGCPVGRSSVHRFERFYREGLETQRALTDVAEKVLTSVVGQDETKIQDAAYQLAFQSLMEMLLKFNASDIEQVDLKQLIGLIQALGRLGGTHTELVRFRDDWKREQAAEASAKVAGLVQRKTLTEEQARAIREEIFGIQESDG
jgi:hypothetical protein